MTKIEITAKQIGVRVLPEQEVWLTGESSRRRVSMSSVVREAIERLRASGWKLPDIEQTSPMGRQIAVRIFADQVEWIESLGGPSAVVREAIRAAMQVSNGKSRRR